MDTDYCNCWERDPIEEMDDETLATYTYCNNCGERIREGSLSRGEEAEKRVKELETALGNVLRYYEHAVDRLGTDQNGTDALEADDANLLEVLMPMFIAADARKVLKAATS